MTLIVNQNIELFMSASNNSSTVEPNIAYDVKHHWNQNKRGHTDNTLVENAISTTSHFTYVLMCIDAKPWLLDLVNHKFKSQIQSSTLGLTLDLNAAKLKPHSKMPLGYKQTTRLWLTQNVNPPNCTLHWKLLIYFYFFILYKAFWHKQIHL